MRYQAQDSQGSRSKAWCQWRDGRSAASSQNHETPSSPADEGTPTMPDQRLVAAGGEEGHQPHSKDVGKPTKPDTPALFIKSRHDDGPTPSKPLPEFNPDDIVGRTF